MADRALRNDEKVGLAAAVALHAALAGVLAMQTLRTEVTVFPERINVSLVSDIGLEAAAPNPVSESRASIAPTLSDNPDPSPGASQAKPEPAARPAPSTPPKPAAQTPAQSRDRSRPDRTPPKPTSPSQPKAGSKSGGSRVGDDFLKGLGSSPTAKETGAAAAVFGAKEAADLRSAISRQIKKNWSAPNGVEAELLVSIVSWKLNPDGSLKGRPTCRTKPESITASNRPQAGLHCERAIRAVQLADFSNLPKPFYSRWDDLEWQFDRRL